MDYEDTCLPKICPFSICIGELMKILSLFTTHNHYLKMQNIFWHAIRTLCYKKRYGKELVKHSP